MSVPKLKNLIILILLLVNLVLLALVIPLRLEQRNQRELAMTQLRTLFTEYDLTLAPDTLPKTQPLYTLELTPASGAALTAAQTLLGENVLAQDDTNPYRISYRTQSGTFQSSRNGEFHAQLDGRAPADDPASEVRALLTRMQLEIAALTPPARMDAGVYEITATQQLLGVPVFSSKQIFTYDAGALTQIWGEALFDVSTLARVDENACIGAADALVAFLGSRNALGWVGSAVTGLSQGYVRADTASAAIVRLIPGWSIVTDTGAFWVSGVTREVAPLPG